MTTAFPDAGPSSATDNDPDAALARGASQHRAGALHDALVTFESALANAPQRVDLAIARSAVLLDLGLPGAAWRAIESRADTLGGQRPHATNVAIFAEAAGELQHARRAYERALQAAPEDLRALNNLALLDARERQWDASIARARACVARAPREPLHAFTLADILINARRPDAALEQLALMQKQFGPGPGVALRAAIALALRGDLGQAHEVLKPLGTAGANGVRDFMRHNHSGKDAPPEDLTGIFLLHCLRSLEECRWDVLAPLQALVSQIGASLERAPVSQDLRRFLTAGAAFGWPESRWQPFRAATARHFAQLAPQISPPLPAANWKPGDPRTRIGLLLPALADHPEGVAMCELLLQLDPQEFAIHVYCPLLPAPDDALWSPLRARMAGMVELTFMNQAEMIGRIRLDRLDVAIDATAMTPWSLEAVLHARIANVQVEAPGKWLTQASPYDYVFADAATHDTTPSATGRLARMPGSCWMALPQPAAPRHAITRSQLGLPESVVLCVQAPGAHIDPLSFSLWMRLLQASPAAVLWLPGHVAIHGDVVQSNLRQQAVAHGIDAGRLVFTPAPSPAELMEHLILADLYVDTTRINSAHALACALQAGTPAITLKGPEMPSRMGASILHAAGLKELVAADADSYVALGTRLLGDANRRAALQQQLKQRAQAADAAAIAAPWAQAFRTMANHGRNISPPVSFTVAAESVEAR